METRKVLGVIFSLIFVVAFGFVLTWGIINFSKVKDGMSGTGVYTNEDINNSYNDGYNTALKDKKEYDELINGYRDTITTLNDNISQLNSKINELTNSNKDYANQVKSLQDTKSANENTISQLNATIDSNNTTIANLQSNIKSLEDDVLELQTSVTSLQSTLTNKETIITGLNSQITDLQNDITSKREQIVELNRQINELQAEIDELEQEKSQNETTIRLKNAEIDRLQGNVSSLENSIEERNTTISNLQSDITVLNNEIADLNTQITTKENTISHLNNQITNLQSLNTQLEQTNQSNLNTISTLNAQIVNLNSQISNLTLQIQNNSNSVSNLNTRIAELETSISYYEQYIASLENDNQVVATFEYDGSVYNIQILNTGDIVSVTSPTSTDYKIFNGWKVNNNIVDLSTYQVNENTKFVADVTYKYDVKFLVDNNDYDSQIVVKNGYATLPTAPTKQGYEFDGWTTDGTNLVSVENVEITTNTTYIAKFTQLFTVNFVYESNILSSQSIRSGNYVVAPTVENTTYKVFNGWTVNNTTVDISTYTITANTDFVADITYKYDVVFKVDNEVYDSQIVVANNYVTLPTNPTKDGYEFDGWSLNESIVNPLTTQITETTTYIAVFTRVYNVVFKYENTTKSTQTIRTGNYATAPTIDTTNYKVFNGWKVDNNIVNVSSYAITTDTEFVADITYKYNVIYKVDNSNYDSQIVVLNTKSQVPTNPTKSGYEFDGWTFNGTIVNPANITITENTTFIAKFTQTFTAIFKYEDSTKSVQTIRTGNYATAPNVESTTYKVFNGWMVNSIIVSIEEYPITANVEFVASFTYKYDAIFMVDGKVYDSQIVVANTYVTLPEDPVTDNGVFIGWSIDGENVIDISSFNIVQSQIFFGIFMSNTFLEKSWLSNPGCLSGSVVWSDGENIHLGSTILDKNTSSWIMTEKSQSLSHKYSSYVWTGGDNVYYSYTDGKHYVFDKENFIWNEIDWGNFNDIRGNKIFTFNGLTFYAYQYTLYVFNNETSTWMKKTMSGAPSSGVTGEYFWTDGTSIYYSFGSSHYLFDPLKYSFTKKTFKGFTSFYGSYVWFDGVNAYYSNDADQYVFNSSSLTWTKKVWHNLTSFRPDNIWTDGTNIYYSNGTNQYVLDKNTSDWVLKAWTVPLFISGSFVWLDGDNVYYSYGTSQYVLNKETKVWVGISWSGLTSFYGNRVWSDGTDIYYSNGTSQYILNRETSTWVVKNWSGLNSFTGAFIWTDETNIYYSNGTSQYVLNKETSSWIAKEWSGLNSFTGDCVWFDGMNIYYSSGTSQYVLDRESSTWFEKTWIGLSSFNGSHVWSDGVNIFYSSGTTHYLLNRNSATWSSVSFEGVSSFNGDRIWTDGTSYYYSNGTEQYILNF